VNSFTRAEGSTYSTALEVHVLAGVAVQVLPTEVVAGVLVGAGPGAVIVRVLMSARRMAAVVNFILVLVLMNLGVFIRWLIVWLIGLLGLVLRVDVSVCEEGQRAAGRIYIVRGEEVRHR
jgi:hypothetical protein